ncbi:MAG: response regulator [Bacteroidetes bacterium]|nr:MAG: response regulator [Bacteroidota bacterium]REK34601.1 MAG: response regulator [Bacteroidota bacterium]
MAKSSKRFLIVDDDPQNNALNKIVLRKSFGEVEVKDFVVPEEALEYLETEFINKPLEEKVTLFLDINMPTLTGWEFLDKFNSLSEPVKKQFNIYMLSSSVDPADIQRANLNPLVIDFIEKPLNKAILTKIFG